MSELKTISKEDVKKFIVDNKSDADFFKKIATYLAQSFNVDFVIIGKLISGVTKVQTEAFYANGSFLDSLVYDLHHTPCENIVHRNACFYPTNIQQLFPKDQELKDLNVQSYLGKRILNKDKEAIGLVALMHTGSIENPEHVAEILEAVADNLTQYI